MGVWLEEIERIEGTVLFYQSLTAHVVPGFKSGTLAPPALNHVPVLFTFAAPQVFLKMRPNEADLERPNFLVRSKHELTRILHHLSPAADVSTKRDWFCPKASCFRSARHH